MTEISALIVLVIITAWCLIRPFYIDTSNFSDNEKTGFEKTDLLRFMTSLEFDLARGLISEAEYNKQKSRAEQRLGQLSS